MPRAFGASTGRLQQGATQIPMDSLTGWVPNLPGASISLVTDNLPTHESNQTAVLKLENTTPGASSHANWGGSTLDFGTEDDVLGFSFYLSEESPGTVGYYMQSSGGNYYLWSHSFTIAEVGWNYFSMRIGDLVKGGAPNLASITFVRFDISSTGATNPYCLFGPLRAGEQDRTRVMLTHDDAPESLYVNGRSLYNDRGLVGTSYTITNEIGAAGFMSLAQLTDLKNDGWDMAGHAHNNVNYLLDGLTDEEILEDMRNCIDWNRDNVSDAGNVHLAYPGNGYDQSIIDLAKQAGYLTGRSLSGLNYPSANGLYTNYILNTANITSGSGETAATILAKVDIAVRDGKSIGVYTHGVVPSGPAGGETLVSEFTALLDGLVLRRDRGLLDVVTVSEYFSGLRERAVSS